MKLAHTTPYFHPEFYGSHEAFLSAELASRGHEVTLFTSDRMPRWGGARGLEQRLPVGESEWRGVRIVRMPAGPTVSFVPSMPALPGHLRKGCFDLFLSHEVFSLAAWHTSRAADRVNKPFVLVQHGYSGGRRPLFKLLFQIEFRALGKRVLQAADQIVTLTEAGKTFLEGLGADPLLTNVIPTGVDSTFFAPRPGPIDDVMRFGFVGRLETDKGVFTLLDAFRRSLRELGTTTNRLVFAGAGDDEEELKLQVSRWGLSDHVDFLGRIPHAQIPDYITQWDALVVPTLQSEPFGIVALEAGAAGVPVIASRLGGLAETVVDGFTGQLVEPGNVDQLAETLVQATNLPHALAQLGSQARQHVLTNYDWKKVTSRFEELFAKTTSESIELVQGAG